MAEVRSLLGQIGEIGREIEREIEIGREIEVGWEIDKGVEIGDGYRLPVATDSVTLVRDSITMALGRYNMMPLDLAC